MSRFRFSGKQRTNPGVPCADLADTDKNEKFIIRKCAGYFCNLLDRYDLLDEESFDFLYRLLGRDIEEIRLYLVSCLQKAQRERLEEVLSADDFCSEVCAEVAGKIIRKKNKAGRSKLKAVLQDALEKKIRRLQDSTVCDIRKNMSSLKKMFSLTDSEVEFTLFFFIKDYYEPASDFFEHHLRCETFMGRKYLSTVLQIKSKELNEILMGKLFSIELFQAGEYICLNSDFLHLLDNPSKTTLSKLFFKRLSRKTVPLEKHLVDKKQTEHLLNLLQIKPETSTHILFYGPAGTGKTSYATALAYESGMETYEIANDEENITVRRRAAVTAALNMTNHDKGSLIIVDEADNILNTACSFFSRGERQDKGWLNQFLEEPGARIIWIVNSIAHMEESVLRRFAFSLHFKPFGRKQRIQLWDSIIRCNRVKRLFSPSDIHDLAKRYEANAGAVDLAVKKGVEIAGKSDGKMLKGAVTTALDAYELLCNGGVKETDKKDIEYNYSPDGLNVEGDIASTLNQVELFDRYLKKAGDNRKRSMNLLLYGPPGTGKSEFARFVGHHLDREIIVKKASDFLCKFVGETEKNIRRAFEKSEREDAVLVIDEVDTLLFKRSLAQRSWEISQTNEFLTQLELYRGFLICTTNRLKSLDHASIRRFNHKIGFHYLRPEGKIIFYRKFLVDLAEGPFGKTEKTSLKSISDLAPGDFRVVQDKFSFYEKKDLTHKNLIQALRDESEIKNVHKGRAANIGF